MLATNGNSFNDIIDNSRKISHDFAEASKNFPKIMSQFDQALSEVKGMASAMEKAGTEVAKTMKNGDEAISQINLQIIPPATDLIYRLESIANNLDIVSRSMRNNPSVIVRGTSAPKPGPGERK